MSKRFSGGKKTKKSDGGGKKPLASARVKNISVALWENEKGNTITISKSYKREGDSEWKKMSITFFPSELGSLDDALDEFCQDEHVKAMFESDDSDSPEPKPDSRSEKSSDSDILQLIAKLDEGDGKGVSYYDLASAYEGSPEDMDEELDELLEAEKLYEPATGRLAIQDVKETLKKRDEGGKIFDNLSRDDQVKIQENSASFTEQSLAKSLERNTSLDEDEAKAVASFVKDRELRALRKMNDD